MLASSGCLNISSKEKKSKRKEQKKKKKKNFNKGNEHRRLIVSTTFDFDGIRQITHTHIHTMMNSLHCFLDVFNFINQQILNGNIYITTIGKIATNHHINLLGTQL